MHFACPRELTKLVQRMHRICLAVRPRGRESAQRCGHFTKPTDSHRSVQVRSEVGPSSFSWATDNIVRLVSQSLAKLKHKGCRQSNPQNFSSSSSAFTCSPPTVRPFPTQLPTLSLQRELWPTKKIALANKDQVIEKFGEELLRESVYRPPWSFAVFSLDNLRPITQFFTEK